MSRRLLAFVGFTLLLAAVVALSVVAEGQAAKPRIRPPIVSLHLDKSVYAVGELPQMTLAFTNPNGVPLTISATGIGNLASVVVKLGKRKIKPLKGRGTHVSDAPSDALVTLAPHENVAVPIPFFKVDRGHSQRLRAGAAGMDPPQLDFLSPRGLFAILELPNPRKKVGGSRVFAFLLDEPGTYQLKLVYKYTGPDQALGNVWRRAVKPPRVEFSLQQ